LNTIPTSSQEAVVIELRTSLLRPIDDLLVVVRKFLYPKMSRSAIDLCLRRHGISNLKDLISEKDGPEKPVKNSKIMNRASFMLI
jgi:hypothetical protein